ncbi:MAG: DegT/DnrJ/EryC1/StrS family aminotransferase [Oligoflexia bacterium]|nr:DegT/DnrJ/EryC1/StrS family aminotransferase [Oligoflexia bacterium]
MKVRYSYLPQQFADPEPIFEEIRKLLKTGDFTLGKEVARFEASFAELIGTKYAIGVGSGTDALKIALEAAGVKAGDEVITAANTFIATVGAIHELGARPVFVDATPYYTIDAEKIEAAITPKTKAIMPVHFTGEVADMKPIMEIAKKYNLHVIEDACQSISAAIDGKNAGTIGLAAGFSLHPLKNLNVWGDAGVIVTNSDELNKKARLIRNHGMKNRDEIEIMGRNSRLDTLQAIVGNWLLPQTKFITDTRIANAKKYDDRLSQLKDFVTLAPRRANVRQVYHLYMFEVDPKVRNDLVKFLLDNGVDAKVHYPIPLPLQEGLKQFGHKRGDFPLTERQADRVVSLPVDQHLTNDQIQYALDMVEKFFKNI